MNIWRGLSVILVAGYTDLSEFPSLGSTIETEIGPLLIKTSLGEGSFGSVFEADIGSTGKAVALKVAKPNLLSGLFKPHFTITNYGDVSHECYMLSLLSSKSGFPRVYATNFDGPYKYYAMELLGKDLFQIQQEYDGKVPTKVVIAIASQMLNRLESLHSLGYLMYDIHLGNFLVHDARVYAIDLAMAFPFMSNGKHIEFGDSFLPNQYKNHVLASRVDSLGFTVSRRDELERFLYLLVILNVGSLPWDGIKTGKEMIRKKLTASLRDICQGEAWWLGAAFKYVFSMRFEDEPNYNFFRNLFDQRFHNKLEKGFVRRKFP